LKLLIISLAGIGDTLFATPLIHELRANFPDARIDALVLWNGSKDLLEGNPHLNSIHQKNLIAAGNAAALKFLGRLRKENYDVSINTHPQSRIHYRFVARVVNARLRLSHKYDNSFWLDRFLVNRVIAQDYQRHSIEHNLRFLDLLGARRALPAYEYEIFLTAAELAWAEQWIAAEKLAGRRMLGIHVGSGGTKNLALRRWPLASYTGLVKRLNNETPDLAILLFGGPDEEKDHHRITAETERGKVFFPRTKNIRQAAALLQKCSGFLSVDTALMHIAAAVKVPNQVVIETPTWNKPIEPYGNPFVLVPNPVVAGRNLDFYRYDGRGIQGTDAELIRCMESVSVDSVYHAIRRGISPATS
jgi:ADP-heptose:LPS heptosyltransferase